MNNLFIDKVSLRHISNIHIVLNGRLDDYELIEVACDYKETFFNPVKGIKMTKRYFKVDKRSRGRVV